MRVAVVRIWKVRVAVLQRRMAVAMRVRLTW